jgi:hypothetical protein
MALYSVALTIKERGRLLEEKPLFDADDYDDVANLVGEIEDVVDEAEDEGDDTGEDESGEAE